MIDDARVRPDRTVFSEVCLSLSLSLLPLSLSLLVFLIVTFSDAERGDDAEPSSLSQQYDEKRRVNDTAVNLPLTILSEPNLPVARWERRVFKVASLM